MSEAIWRATVIIMLMIASFAILQVHQHLGMTDGSHHEPSASQFATVGILGALGIVTAFVAAAKK